MKRANWPFFPPAAFSSYSEDRITVCKHRKAIRGSVVCQVPAHTHSFTHTRTRTHADTRKPTGIPGTQSQGFVKCRWAVKIKYEQFTNILQMNPFFSPLSAAPSSQTLSSLLPCPPFLALCPFFALLSLSERVLSASKCRWSILADRW